MANKSGSKSHGIDKSSRRSRVSLAAVLREDFPNELISEMFLMVLMGQTPLLEKDNRCALGYKVVADEKFRMNPPTLDQRMAVMAKMLDRRDGQAAQHVHIEAELRAEVASISAGVDARYLDQLPEEALLSIRKAVKQLRPVEEDFELDDPDEIQDAELVEPKKSPGTEISVSADEGDEDEEGDE